MTVKEIRAVTGMTQRSFAEKYQIPLQTLKQWESSATSASHRIPPVYVEHMLARLVALDFEVTLPQSNSKVEHLIDAAEDSRYNGRHWMRYLRKATDEGKFRLSVKDAGEALASDRLTMFQKVSLKRATTPNSPTQGYIENLNKRAGTPLVDEIRRRHAHVEE